MPPPQRTSHEFLGAIILYLSLISNICATHGHNNEGESNGLTLKLISRFSISSPVYQANLTTDEFPRQLSDLSEQRATWISSTYRTTNIIDPSYLRPKVSVTFSNWMYAVKVFIGTPPREHYLVFDTGSEFTWIQCEGCNQCFHIKGGNFTPVRSSTYKELSYNDRRCNTNISRPRNKCGYKIGYISHDSSEGVVSTDSFRFDGSSGRLETVSNTLFGCGLKNIVSFRNTETNENVLGGILGMGRGSNSFVSQLGRTANGRFSYCVQPLKPHARIETTLQFGNDATFKRNSSVQTTPLIKLTNQPGYFLQLKNISVNRKILLLPHETFKIQRDGTGGLSSDMGITMTRLYKTPYERLRQEFARNLRAQNLEKIDTEPNKLCYKLPNKTVSWPSVTFHFQDANFHLNHEALFLFQSERFCMAIACSGANEPHMYLGTFQQVGYRFVVDDQHGFMQFAAEDCNS